MGDIISSICAIGLVIGAGLALRRGGVITAEGVKVLTGLTYWAASPAMLFHAISTTDVERVFGSPLLVAALSGLGSALVFVVLGGGFLGLRGGALALGAMSSSLNNAAYIGIPIAVYVLGEAAHVVPILVFQLAFLTPTFFVLADVAGSGRAPTPVSVALTIVKNPMVVAAALGFAVAASGLAVPTVLDVATSMLGEGAPPMILLAFGASLVGTRFEHSHRDGAAILLASTGKLLVQPAIACGVGALLGLRGPALMAVTVMAGLPTAQNAFIAAARAGTGMRIAQGAVLVTTLASLPLTVLTAWIFRSFVRV